jgi:membrane protease YdiL (CAAX protease family)
MTESASLKMMSDVFRNHGQTGFVIPLALMIGATPAICEELLFRGYLQTRLVKSAGPAIGIIIASILFAVFHMDFVHVIAVFPLGLFLGWISWRSASLFPAMIGHFVNNVISVLAVVYAPEEQADVLAIPAIIVSLSIIGLGMIGMAVVIVASVLYGRPDQTVSTISSDLA